MNYLLPHRFYLSKDLMTSKIKREHTVDAFMDRNCNRCEKKIDRPKLCGSCENYFGTYKFYKKVLIKGSEYYSITLGKFDYHSYEYKRFFPKYQKIHSDIKFTGTLKDYQEEAVNSVKSSGILKSPPRSGKTVMGAYIVLNRGDKALIVTHQSDLIKQFVKTFYDLTNIADVEKFNGRKYIGECRTLKDFEHYDICLCTYQMFLHNKDLLADIKSMFGTLIVDECHRGNAKEYHRVLSKFKANFRLGLSATEKRKDGLHFILEYLFGGVIHNTNISNIRPKFYLIPTKLNFRKDYTKSGRAGFSYAMRDLENSDVRNDIIFRYIEKLLKDKKNSIVIPLLYKSQVEYWADRITEKYGNIVGKIVGNTNKADKQKRFDTLKLADEGKYRVTLVMRQLIVGLNVPRWNVILEIFPTSNPYNYEQEVKRVVTPYTYSDGTKKSPKIYTFMDNMGIEIGCFKVIYQTLMKEIRPIMDDKNYARVNSVMRGY
jgi:superfamily II DNA or RNA helicase